MPSGANGVESVRAKFAAALEKDGFPSVSSVVFIEFFLAPEKKKENGDLVLTDDDINATIALSVARFNEDYGRLRSYNPQRKTADKLFPGKTKGIRNSTIVFKNLADFKYSARCNISGLDSIKVEGDTGRQGWPKNYS